MLPGGNVLVTGGGDSAGDTLQCAEEYVPSLNTWLPAPALQAPRDAQTATLLQDGRVLIAAGSGNTPPPLATSELYPAPSPVSISNYLFDPSPRSTKPGQGVLWTDVQGTHTVVDAMNLGESGGVSAPLYARASLTRRHVFGYTFFAAGTYT